MTAGQTEERALVLAPLGRGNAFDPGLLRDAGIALEHCPDLRSLVGVPAAGACLALLSEDAVRIADRRLLVEWVAAQPPWSDLPVIVLARRDRPQRSPRALRAIEALGNVILLDQPFQPSTLAGAVRIALRGRRRQYQARDHFDELSAARAELAEANARLLADMAQREHAEARLRQNQKLEAIGQLAGGIAHDFNNLLTAVMGCLELIRDRAGDARTAKLASHGLTAVQRGAKLTEQLLAFSRMQRLVLAPTEVNAWLKAMRGRLRRALGPRISLRMTLDPSIGPALADTGQLERAMLNLVANARDAMPDGGVLTIGTAIAPGPDHAGYIGIAVSDTGAGMDAELADHAFEPFFTTKETGKGTGLGLAEVYGILRQSGGTATIESAPGAGTTVRLLLPRAACDAPPP